MNVMKKNAFNPIYKMPYLTAADIHLGAFMKKGPTPGTDNCFLIKASGFSATPDILGRLGEFIDYSEDGTSDMAGTTFETKTIQLINPYGIFRVEYDISTVITCTQAVSTTTMTVTSLEDDIDGCFVYVQAGTGAGQTNYATASASGALTLKAAFGTDLDTTSTFHKILPRFHDLIGLNSDGTKLGSQAAAGAIKGVVIDTIIERNNDGGRQMSPVGHATLTGLNNAQSIRFYADVAIRDILPYTVD